MIKERMEQRGQGGFTLIELLVVVAILAILVGVAVVGVGAMQKNAKKSACKSALDTIETAAMAFQISTGNTTDVTGLSNADGGYIKKVDGASFSIDWTSPTNPKASYVKNAASTWGTDLDATCN